MTTPIDVSQFPTPMLSPGEEAALRVEYEQLREEHPLFATPSPPAPPSDAAAWLAAVERIGRPDFRGV